MNGEPFCYGSRVTVRQLLEMRAGGYDLTRILTDHPELRRLGVAAAYCYAADHRDRYAEFFGAGRHPGRTRPHRRTRRPTSRSSTGDRASLSTRAVAATGLTPHAGPSAARPQFRVTNSTIE